MANREMNANVFASLANSREEEQKEIERVGVYGQSENPDEKKTEPKEEKQNDSAENSDVPESRIEETDSEEEANARSSKAGKKAPVKKKKSDKEEMYHLTLSLPKSVAKGLKIMAVMKEEKSVSSMVESWYYKFK